MSQKNINVNQGVLNAITPTYLEFQKNEITLGENIGKFMSIVCYPTAPKYGWLSKLVAIEGTTAKIQFQPTDSGELIERCDKQIRDYRNDLVIIKDESSKQQKEKAIADISEMIRKINEEEEVVGYVNILLFVQAPNQQMLAERVKKVKTTIRGAKGKVRVLTNLQKEAFCSIAPYGITSSELEEFGSRNMPLSTFVGGFPNAKAGINDGIGLLVGKTDDNQLIIIDTRRRGGDRTNMNWFISGMSGVGKSTWIKLLSISEFALGAKIIFSDPEREYIELTKKLGGKVIDCGGGQSKINILQARKIPKFESEIDDDNTSDLSFHFQTVRTFLKLYKPTITENQLSILEEILENTYKRFGIDWNTDISKLKPTEWPILSDLYEDIESILNENPENMELKNLQSLLRSAAIGADSFIFNGHSNIEFNTALVDLDISQLLLCDQTVFRAQTFNINSFVWNYISLNRNEIVFYVVDEGHLSVDPENPESIIFIKNISKRIRKYGGGLIFGTQSCVDILDPAVKRHGQAIIDNACYKFIMGTEGQNLKELSDLFNFTKAEEELLADLEMGRGLLMAGSTRVKARVEVPKKILEIIGTAGGK